MTSIEELQRIFFDLSKPCPKEIQNCQSLRQEFSNELERYKKRGTCSNCIINALKKKYKPLIQC